MTVAVSKMTVPVTKMRRTWEFKVTGYAGAKHPLARPGEELLVTTHKDESSAAAEIDAWKKRMRRGEVSHVALRDLRDGGSLTNGNITADTIIPWSWLGSA